MATEVLPSDLDPNLTIHLYGREASDSAVSTARLLQEFTSEIRELVYRVARLQNGNQSEVSRFFGGRTNLSYSNAIYEDLERKCLQFERVMQALSQMNEHYALLQEAKLEVEVRLADAESVYQMLVDLKILPKP